MNERAHLGRQSNPAGQGTYVICHLPHQLARDLQEDSLQVGLAAAPRRGAEGLDALGQVARQGDVGEDLQVPVAQEAEAGAALDAPQLAVRVNDAVAKEVPQGRLHEGAPRKDALVVEDIVHVARVVDDNAGREAGHVQLEGLGAEEALAAGEPGKELLAGLEEVEAIADEREGVWGFSERNVS